MTTQFSPETDVQALTDAVSEDSDLTPAEKETSIRFAKDQDLATIFTAEAGLMRRLVAHPETAIESLTVLDAAGVRQTVDPTGYESGQIVGVVVTVPVGALQIKSSSRQSTQHAALVSDRVLRGES